MISRPSCDSIIFDLDGTLWDASSSTAQGWNRISEELNLSLSISADMIRSVSGLPFDQCVEKIFANQSFSMPNLKDKLDQAEKEDILKHGALLYPGVQEWLPKLSQHYRLFLVSNCQDWYLKAFLEKSNLSQYFSDSLCFGQTGQPKTKKYSGNYNQERR